MTLYTSTEAKLMEELTGLEIVDAHEHLPKEDVLLAEYRDGLTLFRQYTRLVMFGAGLDEKTFLRMHDPEVSCDERFGIFERYRDIIRASGPARAAYIALKRFYGEDELTRDNFEKVTGKMRELYRPGLYEKVLRRTCGIRVALQNCEDVDYDNILLRPVPSIGIGGEWGDLPELTEQIIRGEHGFQNIEDYVAERSERLRKIKARGARGVKTRSYPYCEPELKEAEAVFHGLRKGVRSYAKVDVPNALGNYLSDRLFAVAGELGLTVAVHTGVWGDYREMDPKNMIPHIRRHPEVKFDLFHMGIPYVRDTGRIGANFGNVWLNMCWAPTISPAMAANALDEWVDQLPANKIIAFGGDVRWAVEKVYGHLVLAREVVATVLARRIDRGDLSWDNALFLVRCWFRDNPENLYGV